MAHIRVIHDAIGETLTIYWAEPRTDQISGETGDGVVLINDARTKEIIGFDRLYYRPQPGAQSVTVESVFAPAPVHS